MDATARTAATPERAIAVTLSTALAVQVDFKSTDPASPEYAAFSD